jgi:bifunctional DNA-binding transcriptional regulator/antitoxin component of YhaV-PrlF toxin-antitoxin module/ribosomal protein L40E
MSLENIDKLCMGCFTELPVPASPCPYCGYSEGQQEQPSHQLRPRSILKSRSSHQPKNLRWQYLPSNRLNYFRNSESQNILLVFSELSVIIVLLSERFRDGGVSMLAEYRADSQIVLPFEIVSKFKLTKGDIFDVTEKDGGIFLYKKEGESISNEEYLASLHGLYGSINDPTFVEAMDIPLELNAPREGFV